MPIASKYILGCLAALSSAMTFAICSILFQKLSLSLSPLGTNFWKCAVGSFLLSIPLLYFGFEKMSFQSTLFLFLSGFLGIAIADTFFFKSLILLGPRLTILLETLSPAFTIVLAIVFLKETLTFSTLIGIVLILSGVSWVLWEQSPKKISSAKWKLGILYAVSFALCMSIGIILTKISVVNISALQATLIRLLSAFVIILSYGMLSKEITQWIIPAKDPKVIKLAAISLFLAIFGGFWLSTVALKFIDASIAIVLNSTAPIFILPLVAIFAKEKISFRSFLGAILALLGIAFIFIK